MKMNDQPGSVVTQFFAALAAVAAYLGVTTQDIVYMIFGLIGVVISLASFLSGRLDAWRSRKEERQRTRMLRDYLDSVEDKPKEERPAAVKVAIDALERAGE
ncbi:hypothetical protein [Dryocola clanedunensis]|uniref:hypothetical protein n=1 Tax=Cedecea sulfonylureivorans TaxID=3051154 RepID=UPI001928A914|nr:hypothetical protein [Cedecea sulfonylureivorans]